MKAVPYSEEYKTDLAKAARLLEEAAGLTTNATLEEIPAGSRSAAFLSNDYYESDLAWMDLDAPIDITIGPYETYNDEMFGYKAAFEAYVNLRDDVETAKLNFFGGHLQEIENNLPIDPKYRNPKLGGQAPIRVVNEVLSAGDGDHGVQTAAYNLPNDERVVTQKGSKRVMLKNVQEAKFHSTLEPISKRVLTPSSQADLSFDSFFTHILAHELSHGIGPHQITVNGRATTPRQELKELYSAIEEAKADVTGLFMLQYLYDHKLIAGGARRRAETVHHVSRVLVPDSALRLERRARQRHGHAGELSDRQRRVRRAPGWPVRGELRQDQSRGAGPGSRSADHRSHRRLRGRQADAG